MRNLATIVATCILSLSCFGQSAADGSGNGTRIANAETQFVRGFLDLEWNEQTGRLYFRIKNFDTPFLYQTSLPRGVGSNDLGLDRGQLGTTRIVSFHRVGDKVLLVQENLKYRALTQNPDEKEATEHSFAKTIVWGFPFGGENKDSVKVDATNFLLRDSHGIAGTLKANKEGDFSVDKTRSAIFMPRTKGFPDNTEMEAIVTLKGTPKGRHLGRVAPDASSITVHMHHSFIRLPDSNYEPLPYDGRTGIMGMGNGDGFVDYAAPIGERKMVNYGKRHRLKKADPAAAISEAVKPIVYYVDRGAPEPIRSALIEGASWWNHAFDAAGFSKAFRVEILPEGADPMDVRYNVIQWVHRSTRGWSYGASVSDPRTGEIMKGHVSLGSLRVRQDYLIAEGLLAPYEGEDVSGEMLKMSLARIRQLAAHEVGHTIGLEHNFAASTQDRASVMDYPFPRIKFDENGKLDLSQAYGVGIGTWDKRAIIYAYKDFAPGIDANAERQKIVAQTIAQYKFVSDSDSRSIGTPHPNGNLWDNGADAIEEFNHLLKVREYVLSRFSERNIRPGRSFATLEEVLVPMYLLHRFQIEAVGKLIGGQYFTYAMRGDGQAPTKEVSGTKQKEAMAALLLAMKPENLVLDDKIVKMLPPRPPGQSKTRELFPSKMGRIFDPLGPAASAVEMTLDVLFETSRLNRMVLQNATSRGRLPGYVELENAIYRTTWMASPKGGIEGQIQRQTNMMVLHRLMALVVNERVAPEVSAQAAQGLERLVIHLATVIENAEPGISSPRTWRTFRKAAQGRIQRFLKEPKALPKKAKVQVPPGSPIGACTHG
ncbi:MAG: hypothetical protein ACI97A_002845 [Planctomycetota bacterium]|jgi:hypothetical protein